MPPCVHFNVRPKLCPSTQCPVKLRPIRYLRHGIDSKLINYFTGNSKTVEKTMEVGFTCTAPPKKRVVCNTMMRKDRIDIPYVMTWSHQRLDGKLKN